MAKANGSTRTQPAPQNVTHEIKDGVLYIGIDLKQRIGKSSTGKTDLVGTTRGSVKLDGEFAGISYSVNAFAITPKQAQ